MAVETRGSESIRVRRWYGALVAWFCLVAIYFLWEALTYHGLYAALSEWQFDRFGWALPVTTYAVLVALFGIPALLLVGWRERRAATRRPIVDEEGWIVARSAKVRSALLGIAAAFAVGMVAALIWTVTLPGFGTPPQRLDASDSGTQAMPRSGPAQLQGHVDYAHVALFTQHVILVRRDLWFAPVTAADPRAPVRYFAQLPLGPGQDRPNAATAIPTTGILLRGGLPGPIHSLYTGMGMPIAVHTFVLYASPATIRWPGYLIAIQLGVASVIMLLVAGIQHRYTRKRRTAYDARFNAAGEAA